MSGGRGPAGRGMPKVVRDVCACVCAPVCHMWALVCHVWAPVCPHTCRGGAGLDTG